MCDNPAGEGDRSVCNVRRLTLAIFAVNCVNSLFAFYIPIALPKIGSALGLDKAGMGWILSSSSVGTVGAALLGGALVDKLGAKRILLAGLGVCSLGYLLAGASFSFHGLVLGLFLLGCAGGLAWPAGFSVLGLMHPQNRRRVFSLLMVFGSGVGSLSAWVYSRFVPHLGDRAVLWPLAGFGIAYILAAWLMSREVFPLIQGRPNFRWQDAGRLIRHPALVLASVMVLLHVGSDTAMCQWMPTFLTQEFTGPHRISPGVALSFYSLSYAASRALMAILPERLPDQPIIFLSSLTGGCLAFASVHARDYSLSMALYPAAAFCFAWEYVALMSMAGARFPTSTGTVYGMLNAMGPVGATIFPALLGQIAETQVGLRGAMTLCPAGFLCLAALAGLWLVRGRSQRGRVEDTVERSDP